MSENITDLNWSQLRTALHQAALPADQQIARLRGYDVAFEVADDFYNWCRWGLNTTDIALTNEQRASLVALNARLDEMSGAHNAELWTEDALRFRPEWDEVRRQARKLLELFQWPIEESHGAA